MENTFCYSNNYSLSPQKPSRILNHSLNSPDDQASSSGHQHPDGGHVTYPRLYGTYLYPPYQTKLDRSHTMHDVGGSVLAPRPLRRVHTHPPKTHYRSHPVATPSPGEADRRIQLLDGRTLRMPGLILNLGDKAIGYGHGKPGWLALDIAHQGEHNALDDHCDQIIVGEDESECFRRDNDSTPRYGRIPSRGTRKYERKRYKLFRGNLVINNEVPSKMLDYCQRQTDEEFKFMRYTAATCSPGNFKSDGYLLRHAMYKPKRETELLIGLTVEDQDEQRLCRSLSGIMDNIQSLVARERSKTWGMEGWKKVVVCILVDGIHDVSVRLLSVLAAMGCYQEGVARHIVGDKPVIAHIYEYTSQMSVTPQVEINAREGSTPVQFILLLKENKQNKINSHRWLFTAFAPILEPRVCILLDVGTMPGPKSIYELWRSFMSDRNLGGAYGAINVKGRHFGANLLNPLVAAQIFECKMDSILEKPLQSVLGYIGGPSEMFSAYRYVSLKNDVDGKGPLQTYFLGEKRYTQGEDPYTANMCLAEDRILSWEIATKRGAAWTVRYVNAAYAEAEAPDDLTELIRQRRKLITGWMFITLYSISQFGRIYHSGHTIARKFCLYVDLLYQAFYFLFSWFALGNYYIAFSILSRALEDPSFNIKGIHIVNTILTYLYLGLVITCYLLALGNRPCPCKSKQGYTITFIGFTFITIYMAFAAGFLAYIAIKDLINYRDTTGNLTVADVVNNPVIKNIIIQVLVAIGAYVLASLLYLEPWHLITSGAQYFLLCPSYIAIMMVYALANIHEVAWLTEPNTHSPTCSNKAEKRSQNHIHIDISTDEEDNDHYEEALHLLETPTPKARPIPPTNVVRDYYYRNLTTSIFLAWTLTNWVLGSTVTATLVKEKDPEATSIIDGYLGFLLGSIAGLVAFRFCGSVAYRIAELLSKG